MDGEHVGDYLRAGRLLRKGGIGAEVYADIKPLGKQLKYANHKGFRIAIIAGTNEFAAGQWQIKDLAAGSQEILSQMRKR